MNLPEMTQIALNHWRTHWPKEYKALQDNGTLQKEAEASAKLTQMEMNANPHLSEHERWEAARELFILTKPAVDLDE